MILRILFILVGLFATVSALFFGYTILFVSGGVDQSPIGFALLAAGILAGFGTARAIVRGGPAT